MFLVNIVCDFIYIQVIIFNMNKVLQIFKKNVIVDLFNTK